MDALKKIQQELKAPKGQYNSFGKFNYRSAEDILESVKPLLAKYDAQLTLSDRLTALNDRIYVEATATIKAGNEVETVTAYAREPDDKKGMDSSQITGTASSYARKYALNGLFLIDDTKDADTDEYRGGMPEPQPEPPKPKKKLSAATVKALEGLISQTGSDRAKLLGYYKVSNIEDMTQEQAKHCMGILRSRTDG